MCGKLYNTKNCNRSALKCVNCGIEKPSFHKDCPEKLKAKQNVSQYRENNETLKIRRHRTRNTSKRDKNFKKIKNPNTNKNLKHKLSLRGNKKEETISVRLDQEIEVIHFDQNSKRLSNESTDKNIFSNKNETEF